MKRIIYCLFCLFIVSGILLTVSCEKEEGIGGKSTITGKVITRYYNSNFTLRVETLPAQDEDVFIVYGDDDFYSDKISTGPDGMYRFEYLHEGSYTVFAYSKDSANYPTHNKIPVTRTIHVSGKNQTIKVPDIVILEN